MSAMAYNPTAYPNNQLAYQQPLNQGQINSYANNYSYQNSQQNNQTNSVTIDFVEDEAAVERYIALPGIMTFLINFNTSTFYIKERNSNGVLQPLRYFSFKEVFPQYTVPNQQTNAENIQTDNGLQKQIDELRQMILSLASVQQPQQPITNNVNTNSNNNSPRNKQKGGNNS